MENLNEKRKKPPLLPEKNQNKKRLKCLVLNLKSIYSLLGSRIKIKKTKLPKDKHESNHLIYFYFIKKEVIIFYFLNRFITASQKKK